ncbi:hypothetical protein [Novosphingobium sp. ST904]|uniref:hypothetical protein n=1 Tax=Novosphingobium sp. ST904 TaxID=1684385 RepID=UPI001E29B026|nr:hypothetical protein [Novosphingobium sp. ST904]
MAEIVNLRGESLGVATAALKPATRIEDLAQQFVAALEDAIAGWPVKREEIFRIGVGLPGIVDSRTGIVEQIITFEPARATSGKSSRARSGFRRWWTTTSTCLPARSTGTVQVPMPTISPSSMSILPSARRFTGAGN